MKHLQAVAYVSAYSVRDYIDWGGEDLFPIYGFDAVCQLPDTAVVLLEDNYPLCVIREACYNDIETIFIMSANEFNFLSSSSVKEVAYFDGDISKFVPKCVETAIHEKLKK